MNKFLPALMAALLFGSMSTLARAQDSVLAELYGQGVHSYFSGNLSAAHELLTSAIEQGSRDPRAYYFRALTYQRLGRPDEADADLKKGAVLEATSTDRIYPVAVSLQRVQGPQRMRIERQRQMARLAVKIRQNQIEQARYQQSQQPGQDAVERPAAPPSRAVAPATAPPATAAPATATPAAEETDPFAAEAAVTPEKAPAKAAPAAAPTAPANEDPFGSVTPGGAAPATPAAPAPAPAAEADPFAPATPAAPAAPATPDATTDPFSDDKPADAAPAEAPAEKPAEADPFGE